MNNLKIDISGSVELYQEDGIYAKGKLGNLEFSTKVADINYTTNQVHLIGVNSDGIIPIQDYKFGLLGLRIGDFNFNEEGLIKALRIYGVLRLSIDLELVGDIAEMVGIESPYVKDIIFCNSFVKI